MARTEAPGRMTPFIFHRAECIFIFGFFLLVAFVLVTMWGEGGASGATITVDDNEVADHQSIQAAIDTSDPGDTIIVGPGTYNENLIIHQSVTILGSIDQDTHIDCQDGIYGVEITTDDVVLRNLTFLNSEASFFDQGGVRLSRCRNVTLDRILVLDNLNGISVWNCSQLEIRTCTSQGNGVGITIDGSSYIGVIDCNLEQNEQNGVIVEGSDNITIGGNRIRFNENYGIRIEDADNATIQKNDIENNNQGGIDVIKSRFGTIISGNTVTGNGGYGIWIRSEHGGLVIGNILSNNSHSGISLPYVSSNGARDWNIMDNIITGSNYGINVDASNNYFHNNTIMNNSRGIDAGRYADHNVFRNNSIFNNSIGLESDRSASFIVDAIHNWWGNESGPYHWTKNPTGGGNPCGPMVNFIPWIGMDHVDRILIVEQGSLYPTIGEAVKAARSGETIRVPGGTYYESHISIDIPLTIRGNGSENTLMNGMYEGSIFIIRSSNVTISGFSFRTSSSNSLYRPGIVIYQNGSHIHDNNFSYAFNAGISIASSDSHRIERNHFQNIQGDGIEIASSRSTVIRANTIESTTGRGLDATTSPNLLIESNSFTSDDAACYLKYSDQCTLRDNDLASPDAGLHFYYSAFTKLRSNRFSDAGINVYAFDLKNRTHDIDTSNVIRGIPIQYLINVTNIQLPDGSSQVFLVNCTNISLSGGISSSQQFTFDAWISNQISLSDIFVHESNANIMFTLCDDISIFGNTLIGNDGDMTIKSCLNISFRNNRVENNSFEVSFESTENVLIENNGYQDFPRAEFFLTGSSNCTVRGNVLSMLFIDHCHDILISGNTCSSRIETGYVPSGGILLRYSNDVYFSENLCYNNSYGIICTDTSNIEFSNDTIRDNWDGGIRFTKSHSISLLDMTITGNGNGIRIDRVSRNFTINTSTFTNNAYGIFVFDSSNDIVIRNCTFLNNTFYAILAEQNQLRVDALYNYWGDNSGPFHPIENSMGRGGNVSDEVHYHPWLELSSESSDGDNERSTQILWILLLLVVILLLALVVIISSPDPGSLARRDLLEPLDPLPPSSLLSSSLPPSSLSPDFYSVSYQDSENGSDPTADVRSVRPASWSSPDASDLPSHPGPRCTNCGSPVSIPENDRSIRIPCPECGMHLLTERTFTMDPHLPRE